MTTEANVLVPILLPPEANPLRLAVAAYLARFKGQSRIHNERVPDLGPRTRPGPLTAKRAHLELYVRWMQEIRRYKPSTVSRRMAVPVSGASLRASTVSASASSVGVSVLNGWERSTPPALAEIPTERPLFLA